MVNRRKFLTGMGITVGVLGLGGAVLTQINGDISPSQTSDTANRLNSSNIQPETTVIEPGPAATGSVPWDKQELVIGFNVIQENHADVFGPRERLLEAVTFWNSYIAANESFDLSLAYDPDAANPDIEINVDKGLQLRCDPEYKTVPTSQTGTRVDLCVHTVREQPGETPVNAHIGNAKWGLYLWREMAKHAIGRLIGYNIKDEPASVMSPKLRSVGDPSAFLHLPARIWRQGQVELQDDSFFPDNFTSNNPGQTLKGIQTRLQTILQEQKSPFENEIIPKWRDAHADTWVEAYQQTIVNDEWAWYQETIDIIEEAIETESYERAIERVEQVSDMAQSYEPYDLRIHRYWADKAWNISNFSL